jgi:glutamate-ammonia-ligase adenylyltransferase
MPSVVFGEPARAEANLARIRRRVPPDLADLLPTLLADSPDPDGALNLFERLCESADEEVFRLFDRHRFLAHYAVIVFGYSQFLGETLIQNQDLLHELARDKNLDLSLAREEYSERFARFRSRASEVDFSTLLARFKRREYVRIMLRDVLNLASLAEVTAEISALADVLIEQAFLHAHAQLSSRHGSPQYAGSDGRLREAPFTVLSLGKLGGNELNYSSDIDLLYLHGDGENPAGAITNREYFIRLAQQITEILSRPTVEGAVFRIDLRLRPQGSEGEPVSGLAEAQRYYAAAAHDWELQALIKARHSAGSLELAREFIRGVQPRVYTTDLNFAAIETALMSREKMGRHRRKSHAAITSPGSINIKLDCGGIRDIEFLVQCLQRVYGGPEAWLRSRGTLFSLQKLHDKNHLSGKDFHELNSSYEFFRRVEHRLQLRRGQQTHRLPQSGPELEILNRSIGEHPSTGGDRHLLSRVRESMIVVGNIYSRIIHAEQIQHGQDEAGTEFRLRPLAEAELGREQSFFQILQRLAADAPAIYEIAARRDLSSRVRRNLHRFLSSALTSSERYTVVLGEPAALEKALHIFEVSDYLTDVLVRYPEELGTLAKYPAAQPAGPALPLEQNQGTGAAGDAFLQYVAAAKAPYSEKLSLLRQHYRRQLFANGVRDFLEERPVFDSLHDTSTLADSAIEAALAIAREGEISRSFAVLALGRLGTNEFDIGSDADLLFLSGGQRGVHATARIASQIVEVLSAYTREGTLFAVDARLRPRGTEGELVTTVPALRSYFGPTGEARAWEALSYTKLRFVAGSGAVAEQASEVVQQGLERFQHSPEFAAQVREMRARLVEADFAKTKEKNNFKKGEGGFYDVDFIVSYLLVRSGMAAQGNIRDRLYALASTGWLSDTDCATLDYAAELLRTVDHVIRLVSGRARKVLPAAEHTREIIEQLVSDITQREFEAGLENEMQRVFREVRGLYSKLIV